MKRYNVIFLDFDNVLNKVGRVDLLREPLFEKDNVYRFVYLLGQIPDPAIVISSGWRQRYSFESLKKILGISGVPSGFVVDATPVFSSRTRGAEIRWWLNNHPDYWKNFVILDDRSDMEEMFPHLVQTEKHLGLTFDGVEKAKKILML